MPMRSLAISMRSLGLFLACSLFASGSVAADDSSLLHATASEPRAFGYFVGDRVLRDVSIHVPTGLKLDEESLPRPGARGLALELQQLSRRSFAEAGGTREELQISYQVFKAPTETRTLETATILLHFKGQPRAQDLRIEAWPVNVSPLVQMEAPSREGLGELRPDQAPLQIPTGPWVQRLWIEATAALLLLGYLAQVYLVMPWWTRRRRPFGAAWRHLRALPAGAGRASLQRMHEALNEAAGEVLFAQGLERFLALQPRYEALRADFVEFFQRSRQAFFGEGSQAASPDDGRWLLDFSRKCRDAERGAA